MAAASGEGTAGTRLLPAGTALALLGGLVYLGTLCAVCKRKGRKKVAPDGVKLVEEALLCQTQLRSLSKSDTKLHELYRVKVRDVQRPASLDLPGAAAPGGESLHSSGLLHRELPQIPVPEPLATSPAPDQTYSNLLFTPLRKPAPDAVYECLAVGEEGTPVLPSVTPVPPMPAGTQLSPPRAGHGAADYACVHKVKKVVSVEGQDGAVAGASGAQHGWDGTGSARHAKLEEMYSTVCKATKKKSQVPGSTPRAVKDGVDPPSGGPGGSGGPPPYHQEGAPAAPGPPDPCYESINDRAWTAQARGPEPDYEAVDIHWKKAAKGAKPGKGCVPENLYESVVDVWAGGSQKGSARTAANGLQVYITNL